MFNWIKHLKNKELFIALYFFIFIFGISLGISGSFYNELRVLEFLLVFSFAISSVFYNYTLSYKDYLFLCFILVGTIFWENSEFIVYELLLFFLIYKSFSFLKYNENYTKIIIFLSLFIFLFFPFSVWNYIVTGEYHNWYPMPWNIRVYDSYFLIFLIFSTWFILKKENYNWIYLLFNYLALLAILLDGGRSVLLAYSILFIAVIFFNKEIRLKLIFTYVASWFSFLSIVFSTGIVSNGTNLARVTTSLRSDLWMHALKCWIGNPILGGGFYQLGKYENLAAHPHNLFIQILTETGLIGFSFLAYIIFTILRNISWNFKENYFVISAFIAVTIELSFSGIHIYPVTQIALLWLFIFLLKNPEFKHAAYFNQQLNQPSKSNFWASFLIYILIAIVFINLFLSTSALSESLPSTPPRFWEYGYQLF